MSIATVHYVPATEVSAGDMLPQWGQWYTVISAEITGSRVKVWTESWGVMWFAIHESVRVLAVAELVQS
jgi:hypothetical protein